MITKLLTYAHNEELRVLPPHKPDNAGSESHKTVSTTHDDDVPSQCYTENYMFRPFFTHKITPFLSRHTKITFVTFPAPAVPVCRNTGDSRGNRVNSSEYEFNEIQ
jgi:hypothetical protein